MQNGQPVAYASRALTSTEQNYAQIEKELLSIVFGAEKFHQYTYGRKVHVESDHKPLETIHTKPLVSAPKRLQRILLRLQRYDLEIKYKPGKDMHLADTLSRAYLPNTTSENTAEVMHVEPQLSATEVEVQHIKMSEYLPITKARLTEIQKATMEDNDMQTLSYTIKHGLVQGKKYSPELQPYHQVCDEPSEQDGIIFKGNRCVIPTAMRSDILERIHRSHIGTQGCLRRARECVYWPGMTTQIKSRVTRCETCRAYERAQQKETLCSHEVSARPWAKVASDMFELVNKNYLVMVDYYSKMSKRTKTLLPTQAKLLEPKIEKTAKEKLDAARKKQALQYNKTARDLPALTAGQTVRIQPLKKPKQPWEKAEVQYQVNHRSYQLLTENGKSATQ